MFVGLMVAVSLQALVMFGPLGYVFDIQEVPLATLAISSGVMMVAVLGVAELHKLIYKIYLQKKIVAN